jgi:dUTP pyrophosphatase
LIPPYEIGERCAQIYFEKVLEVEFQEVDDLTDTERGEGGFGSTGLK